MSRRLGTDLSPPALMRRVTHYLRMWDVSTAPRVSAFAAISNFVARRKGT